MITHAEKFENTRHREYSLGVALLAAVALYFFKPDTISTLLLLNVLAVFSILYSAFSVVRHADVLAHRFGEPYGSLILSLAIVILEAGMIATLMLSGAAGETMMRDTIYSVLIIVMSGLVGLSLMLGGVRYKSQNFNSMGIKHYLMSIIPLALIVLALPATLKDGSLTTAQLTAIATCCAFVYYMFLRIQTVTHRRFFVHEAEDGDDGGHGKPSSHGTPWHFAWLGIHLAAVIGITKMNSYPLEQILSTVNAPPAFAGFLIAVLILSPESTAALGAVMRGQAQRAMNLLLGAVLATISLTVPLVVGIAVLTGQNIILGLPLPNILLLFTTLILCQTSLTGGRTNAHSGSAHLIIFVMYVMLIFN